MAKPSRKNAIAEQFAARPVAMLETVMSVASRAAHQVLIRIEIENAHHGGKDNGHLPVTFQDFERFGVHLHSIAPAIRELVALGLIEVTQRGSAGNAEFRRPSLYRLTYRHAKGASGDGTHEWRRIKTVEEAEAVAKAARQEANPTKVARGKKQNFTAGNRRLSLPETGSENANSPLPETGSTSPLSETCSTIDILGGVICDASRGPAQRPPQQASWPVCSNADQSADLQPLGSSLENLKRKIANAARARMNPEG